MNWRPKDVSKCGVSLHGYPPRWYTSERFRSLLDLNPHPELRRRRHPIRLRTFPRDTRQRLRVGVAT